MSLRPVEAVVVAYGCDDRLRECLEMLAPELPTIVVDNSSHPGVRALAQRLGATYDDPRSNLGFASGVNRGLRRTCRDADVLLVNPDALITPEAISQLRQAAAHAGVAAAAPRLREPESGVESRVLWPFPTPAKAWRQALGLGDGKADDQGYVVGAVLLLTRPALDAVGGFDERFFLYAEEADWQKRAFEQGWRSVLCSDAHATHVGAGTSSDPRRREILFYAGGETYIRKWFGSMGWASYRTANIVGALLRAAARPSDRGVQLSRAGLFLRGPRRTAGLQP